MNIKEIGSFYTPEALVQYMCRWITTEMNPESILEPSAGDGRFIKELLGDHVEIDAVEMIETEVIKMQNRFHDVNIICDDFTNYCMNTERRYDLIIGNPPYISKKDLDDEKRKLSLEVTKSLNLDESYFQNLWVTFILGAIKLLQPNGAIFFVLPFEFLQVQYAEKLRNFLETRFNRIEITTFNDKVFRGIEQDVCLVYMTNIENEEGFIRYKTLDGLENFEIVFESVIQRNRPLSKWSNCILNDEETDFLHHFSLEYTQIRDFGNISPGIVTGANAFFIIDQERANEINMPEAYLSIIQKGIHGGNKLLFTEADLMDLVNGNQKIYLLNLGGIEERSFTPALNEYLEMGKGNEIDQRYKCSIRNRWFDVPIVGNGQASFFKRFNQIPRIIINENQVHTTDIAYNIRFYEEYDPRSFAFCFYNSLTLALCE